MLTGGRETNDLHGGRISVRAAYQRLFQEAKMMDTRLQEMVSVEAKVRDCLCGFSEASWRQISSYDDLPSLCIKIEEGFRL